jgi:hypothetical protein
MVLIIDDVMLSIPVVLLAEVVSVIDVELASNTLVVEVVVKLEEQGEVVVYIRHSSPSSTTHSLRVKLNI